MNHRKKHNALNLKSSHRKALIRNLVTSLFLHERIITTFSRAKAAQSYAEKVITRAKQDTVHNRRVVRKTIESKEVLIKLFEVLGPRFKERAGGYTRILKLGPRQGDAAERALFELVDRTKVEKAEKSEKPEKAEKPEKTEKTEKVKSEDTSEKKVKVSQP